MGEKYVVREELDIWGDKQTVIKRSVTAEDVVGGALTLGAIGASLLVAKHQDAKNQLYEQRVNAIERYLQIGDHKSALITIEQIIGMSNPTHKLMGQLIKAGLLTEDLKQYAEAIDAWNAALVLSQGVPEIETTVYLKRGMCYYYTNNIGAAIRDFTKCVQLKPEEFFGHLWLGIALAKLGDLDQAIAKLNQSISLAPGEASIYSERAKVYLLLNQTQKAIDDLSKAIVLAPQLPAYYRRRAELYVTVPDYAKAIADYSSAIEREPDYMENYKARAAVYQLVGDTTRHAADLAKVAHEEPLQQEYQQYLKAATAAYDHGITSTYTRKDTSAQPEWEKAILRSALLIAGGVGVWWFATTFSYGKGNMAPCIFALVVMGLVAIAVWMPIAAFNEAKEKVNKSTTYFQMLSENEPQTPGFEEFFRKYLEARKGSRLQDLPAQTRTFFESDPRRRAVWSSLSHE
jgi:tetratricopeptide (TPR) repeat protein